MGNLSSSRTYQDHDQPTFKKIKFQLKSIASDKFPEFPSAEGAPFFDIPVKEFKEMIYQTVFAVSDDETRYFMNGVYLENNAEKLVMVATDGRRLAYISKSFGTSVPVFKGVIVPPKVLNLITKRAGDEGPISIAVTDKCIFLKFGSYNLSSVLIEGQFSNYQRVILRTRPQLLSEQDRTPGSAQARIPAGGAESRGVYLTVSSGMLSISSEESEIGTAKGRYSLPGTTAKCDYRPQLSILGRTPQGDIRPKT
jgi:DNA polymerase-3 subunit beta